MPAGAAFFGPDARFSFNRGYVYGIAHNISGYVVLQSHNVFTWVKVSDPNEQWTITFRSEFFAWSSNTYTLDYLVVDFYYRELPDPTIHVMPYTLNWFTSPIYMKQYLEIRYDSVDFGVHQLFDLPPQPAGYWVAPPL